MFRPVFKQSGLIRAGYGLKTRLDWQAVQRARGESERDVLVINLIKSDITVYRNYIPKHFIYVSNFLVRPSEYRHKHIVELGHHVSTELHLLLILFFH